MTVDKLMMAAVGRLVTLKDSAPLIEAAKLLRTGIEIVVVCNSGGAIVGVITKTDVVARISQCEGAGCIAPVARVMATDVVSCYAGDSLKCVWETMKLRKLKNIPVTNRESHPLGVVTARDVLECLLEDATFEESQLRDYVMGFGYR